MEKMAKRFKRIAGKSKDEYIIPDTLWQSYWQKTVNEAIDDIVKWINEHDKLEKEEEDPDYHIRGRSTK